MLGLFLRNIIHEVEMVFSLPRRLTQKNQSLVLSLTHTHLSSLERLIDWMKMGFSVHHQINFPQNKNYEHFRFQKPITFAKIPKINPQRIPKRL